MSVYVSEKRVLYDENCEEKLRIVGNIDSSFLSESPTTMEQEKKIRREIANSNERRRMQSINNGFQSLRSLLPHHEGEKLSKAAILQQTAEYIYNLEQEKTHLLSQNCQLKRLVSQHEGGELPPKKRKTEVIVPPVITEATDEGIGMSPESVNVVTVAVNQGDSFADLMAELEVERSLRQHLEKVNEQLENQLFQQQPLYPVEKYEESEEISLQLVDAESLPPVGHTQTVVCSPPVSRSPSPAPVVVAEQRLPSVLEAAIKAEPKVEVERLPSPSTPHEDNNQARLYVSNTSRQNLETIVEAIRHLEGDHMFGDEPQTQEVPLALTTRPVEKTSHIKIEMNQYIEYPSIQQQQQSRPGVIVGKQSS